MINRERDSKTQVASVVHAARRGDDAAWSQLVARHGPMLRGIAHSYRLSRHDVDDVVQTTFLRLYEHIDRIREPAAVPGWLATTVRRESMRLLQSHVREAPTDDPELGAGDASSTPHDRLLASERRIVLGRALAALPERQRALMALVAVDTDYREISAKLAMPVGSIGPIRARSLARLQRDADLREHRSAS
ncbi:MAG: RNA polymerase sigma factor [Solirubrobacteraceae bacterium]